MEFSKELRSEYDVFPAPGRCYSAEFLGEMVSYGKEWVRQLLAENDRLSKLTMELMKEGGKLARLEQGAAIYRGVMPTADEIAVELKAILPQLDPALLELIKAHVAPKHVDVTPHLDAEILAERIRCARIVSDIASAKRMELILSGEDIDGPPVAGGISG
jgi:hypothetical protein